MTSAFGVERGVVDKGAEKVVGTRGDKRNTKYTAAVLAGTNTTGLLGMHHPAALAAGGAIGASMYHAHRHSPSGAAGIRRSRAAAQKRRATAKEVGPTLRAPVGKSAFGVELGDVEKAFDKTKERNASDKKLRSQLSRGEGLKAAAGAGLYTAAKAPSGKRGEAFREHGRYMSGGKSKGGLVGLKKPGLTHRGAYVHTRQKMDFGKSAFGVEL